MTRPLGPNDPTNHRSEHTHGHQTGHAKGAFSKAALETSKLMTRVSQLTISKSNELYDGFLRSPRLEQMGLKGLGHKATRKGPETPRAARLREKIFNKKFIAEMSSLRGKSVQEPPSKKRRDH